VIFPLVFASSAFVPTSTMPPWLQAFANHQPVSAVINAVRDLVYGPELTQSPPNPVPINVTHDVLLAIAWIIVITAVFAPLAVRSYRRKVS